MKPTPQGWPRISAAIACKDAARHIDWLCEAFGFEVRLKVVGDGGRIEHSELTFGDGVVMVSSERRGDPRFGTDFISPLSAGGATQTLMLYVDDADTHCEQSRKAGARIVAEPADHDYGDDYWADRSYGALDPEGHIWWISQRIRTLGK